MPRQWHVSLCCYFMSSVWEVPGAGLSLSRERADPSLPAGPGKLAQGSAWPAAARVLPGARAAGTALTGSEGLFCCHWDQNASLQQQLHSPTCPPWLPKRDRPGFTSGWVHKVWWHSKGTAVTQQEGIFYWLSFLSHCIVVKIWKTYGPTGTIWCLAAGLSPLGKEAFSGGSAHLEPVVVSHGVLLKLQTQKVKESGGVAF